MNCMVVVLCSVWLGNTTSPSTDQPRLHGQALRLVPSTTTIRAFDPFFLRIELHNYDDGPFVMKRPPRFSDGSVSIEIKKLSLLGGTDSVVTVSGQPGATVYPLEVIPARSMIASFAAIFLWGDNEDQIVFAQEGTYQLQAMAWIDKQLLATTPVIIHVTPIPPEERKLIEREAWVPLSRLHKRSIFGGVASFYQFPRPGDIELKLLTDYVRRVTSDRWKRLLRWRLALSLVRSNNSLVTVMFGLAVHQQLCQESDRVTAEYMQLTLARQLFQEKLYHLAFEVTQRIKTPSWERESILRNLPMELVPRKHP